MIPRSEGLLTVSVYDLCLDSTGPAILHVQISDVYGVDVAVVNKVHENMQVLCPVHTYPEIFVSANFFMRIHLASTRVRRIRSVYPEISVYAL